MLRKLWEILYNLLENPKFKYRKVVDITLALLVWVSVGGVILSISLDPENPWQRIGEEIDIITLYLFALELLIRIWVSANPWEEKAKWTTKYSGFKGKVLAWLNTQRKRIYYLLSPLPLIDLVALIPLLRPLRMFRFLRMFRIFKLARYSRFFSAFVDVFVERRKEFMSFMVIVLALVMFAGVTVYLVERKVNSEQFGSLIDSIWWSVVTLTTVGYGDKYPVTQTGRTIAAFMMLAGIGVIALPSGLIASALTEKLILTREGKLMKKGIKNHILICGWNAKAHGLIDELKNSPFTKNKDIVVVTTQEIPENLKQEIVYYHGDFIKENVLVNAGVKEASEVIILAENPVNLSEEGVDARTLLTAMIVESLKPGVHIVAEIIDADKASILKSKVPTADVVVNEDVVGKMLSSSVVSPGVVSALSELLSQKDNTFVRSKVPDGVSSFGQLIEFSRRQKPPQLPVAVVKSERVFVNPEDDFLISENDEYIYIRVI